METVTLSPKYQMVIPRKAREKLGLEPGQKFRVMVYEGRIELIPLHSLQRLRGFLHGIATDVPREDDRS